MAEKLTPRGQDFNEWYNEVVIQADMADYGPVRGTMIVKPYGWALWENVQKGLDQRFKATGHVNAGFPMFIPYSFLQREAKHIEGFSPQLAVVTHAGGEKLEEPLVVRPTSETLIGYAFAKWIRSYRDLPVLLNLWNSVVRWELRTKLFLRTSEFYWQEGHTAHATEEEAQAETLQMLRIYADFAVNEAAIPVVPGEKSAMERFAGADQTLTIEAMMGDGRALQSATSHNLGQNFAKAFDIKYLDRANSLQHCWTTSWGLSTRFIGAMIMVHGDDQGLILPPRLAPYQVVVVPIFRSADERTAVLDAVQGMRQELEAAGLRVKVDERDDMSPGFKFNEWELRGVPCRIEIGPRDLANGVVVAARRDQPGKAGKQTVARGELVPVLASLLDDIQSSLLARATKLRDDNTFDVRSYGELKEAVEKGFARAWWAGSDDDERRVQEETRATLRCYPLDQPGGHGVCILTGKPASRVAVFGRAY